MKHLVANNSQLQKVAAILPLNSEDYKDASEPYELSTKDLEVMLGTVRIFSK